MGQSLLFALPKMPGLQCVTDAYDLPRWSDQAENILRYLEVRLSGGSEKSRKAMN